MEPIMLTTIPPFQVVSHVMKKPPSFSLRGRRLKGKGKGVLCARETRGAGEEGERETAFPSLPPSSRVPRAPNPLSLPFQTPATQPTKFGRKKLTLRQRKNALSPVPAGVFFFATLYHVIQCSIHGVSACLLFSRWRILVFLLVQRADLSR